MEQEQQLRNLRLFFFDTETNGLPKDPDGDIADSSNWPHMVQLSWIVTNGLGDEIERKNFIIKPTTWKIPPMASGIHGITTEIAKEKGTPIGKVLTELERTVGSCQLSIGHNVSFDENIVRAELARKKRPDIFQDIPGFCTMIATTDFCALEGKDGNYKFPSLQELHMRLFGKPFHGAHNAMADVEATKDCFFELNRRGIVIKDIPSWVDFFTAFLDSISEEQTTYNENVI